MFQSQELGADKYSAPAGTVAAASIAAESLPCSSGYGPTVTLKNIFFFLFKRVSGAFLCAATIVMFTQKEIRLSPSGRATYWKSILRGEGEGYLSALFVSKEKKRK